MKKAAPPVQSSGAKAPQIEAFASKELEAASRMDGISAASGDLTPVEAAILSMNSDLQNGMRLIREIKNQTAMLETAFKLMSYEISVIAKHCQKGGEL